MTWQSKSRARLAKGVNIRYTDAYELPSSTLANRVRTSSTTSCGWWSSMIAASRSMRSSGGGRRWPASRTRLCGSVMPSCSKCALTVASESSIENSTVRPVRTERSRKVPLRAVTAATRLRPNTLFPAFGGPITRDVPTIGRTRSTSHSTLPTLAMAFTNSGANSRTSSRAPSAPSGGGASLSVQGACSALLSTSFPHGTCGGLRSRTARAWMRSPGLGIPRPP